jgi:hypothetical protein
MLRVRQHKKSERAELEFGAPNQNPFRVLLGFRIPFLRFLRGLRETLFPIRKEILLASKDR